MACVWPRGARVRRYAITRNNVNAVRALLTNHVYATNDADLHANDQKSLLFVAVKKKEKNLNILETLMEYTHATPRDAYGRDLKDFAAWCQNEDAVKKLEGDPRI